MITKAGVTLPKITVGLSSYGRSSKLTEASCTSLMCRYKGPDSDATPGDGTNTPTWISDAEIYSIIEEASIAARKYDNGSESNILVYDSTQRAEFMHMQTRKEVGPTTTRAST